MIMAGMGWFMTLGGHQHSIFIGVPLGMFYLCVVIYLGDKFIQRISRGY